jgi:hypothetical protein
MLAADACGDHARALFLSHRADRLRRASLALIAVVTTRARPGRSNPRQAKRKKRKRKPPAAESFREERQDGWFRPHPQHPWLDPAACGDPGHVPARQGVAVDGKERKGAKAGGGRKVHLLAAVTHTPGIVITQDRGAKAGKANEISHFKPPLAPLPIAGTVVTSDAMQANRDNSLFLRKGKDAHWLWPILGNQPNLNETLNALSWETMPVAAATSEISRGRIETRTIRVLPAPTALALRTRARPCSPNGTSRTRRKAGGIPGPRPSSTSPA